MTLHRIIKQNAATQVDDIPLKAECSKATGHVRSTKNARDGTWQARENRVTKELHYEDAPHRDGTKARVAVVVT